MIVGTNMAALRAANAMRVAEAQIEKSMQRIATGKRINSAADDPAGLAIAMRMSANIGGVGQAIRNAQDGISRAQTADGYLDEVSNLIQRVRELSVEAASGTYNDTDRAGLDVEVKQLTTQIRKTLEGAKFNGGSVFGVSGAGSGTPTPIQTGPNKGDTTDIDSNGFDLSSIDSLTVLTAEDAGDAMATLDDFLKKVSSTRAKLGATLNVLNMSIDGMSTNVTNLQDAYSRIMDADIPAETMNLARAQLMLESSTAMLVQANKLTRELVETLLKN